MKLISCHIENFGHLRNYDHTFTDGLNVFIHENGWGKTTLVSFLCAMLYGMPGTRKRKTAENERERFRPWQGGTYGGRLLFETGGRLYEVTRTFGKREKEDTFELRDVETNLPEFRFSSFLGQGLFALDRESFCRTALIGQQDCATRATGDVQALLADLAELPGDLGSYEDAMKRLADAAASLTPRRRTGSLHRREEEIRLLEREAAGIGNLEERILACETQKSREEEREKKLEEEVRALESDLEEARLSAEAQIRAAGAVQEEAAAPEILRRLRQTALTRRESAMQAASFFPGRIPARVEVEEHLRRCRSLERLEYRMQEYMLSEKEQDRLTQLEEMLAEETGDGAEGFRRSSRRVVLKKDRPDAGSLAVPLFFGAGLFILAAGILLGILQTLPLGAAVSAAGIVVILAAGALQSESRETRRETRRGKNPEAEYRTEYERLMKKEQKLEETHAQWAELRRPILEFLRETGFDAGEDLRSQLEKIRDAADEYEDASRLLQEAEADRKRFEEQSGERRLALAAGKDLPDASSRTEKLHRLHRRLEEAHTELLKCRGRIEVEKAAAEELRAEQEEAEEAASRLAKMREKQEEETVLYRHLLAASVSLQRAKEGLTARYADPVRRSFAHCWEQITSSTAAGVYVDANTDISVEELGRQREIDLFSAGYRDLAGICLRIALVDAMYKRGDRPPLILDDPFTALDDDKLRGAARLLQDCAGRYQILYFTCSKSRCL